MPSSWCWVLRRGAWETAVSCGRVAWTAPRRAMWIRDIRCAWRSGAHVVHCLGRASRVVLGGVLGRPGGSAGALASKRRCAAACRRWHCVHRPDSLAGEHAGAQPLLPRMSRRAAQRRAPRTSHTWRATSAQAPQARAAAPGVRCGADACTASPSMHCGDAWRSRKFKICTAIYPLPGHAARAWTPKAAYAWLCGCGWTVRLPSWSVRLFVA